MSNDPRSRTGALILALLGLMGLVHLLVLGQLLPYSLVWGGRIESTAQMYRLESVALVVLLAFIAVTAMASGHLRSPLPRPVLRAVLWVLCAYFLLNTLGNALSHSLLERVLFTPLAIALAYLYGRLARLQPNHEAGTGSK